MVTLDTDTDTDTESVLVLPRLRDTSPDAFRGRFSALDPLSPVISRHPMYKRENRPLNASKRVILNIYRVELLNMIVAGSATIIITDQIIQFMNLIHLFLILLVPYFTSTMNYRCEFMFISCDLFHK